MHRPPPKLWTLTYVGDNKIVSMKALKKQVESEGFEFREERVQDREIQMFIGDKKPRELIYYKIGAFANDPFDAIENHSQ